MKIYSIAGLLLCMLTMSIAHGQVKPDYFPEDISPQDLVEPLKCYCEPGIKNKSRSRGLEISYGLHSGGVYEGENNTILTSPSATKHFGQLKFRLTIPIINKTRIKFLLGFKHFSEMYNFKSIGNDFSEVFTDLSTKRFKNSGSDLVLAYSADEINYFVLRGGIDFNGDYGGVLKTDEEYRIYKMTALYGFKKNDDFEWGIGINYNKSFRQTFILPFILYNRNFNSKWGVEATLPANAFLRHNLNSKTILLTGVEYASKSYRFDVQKSTETIKYAYNHSELLTSVSIDYYLGSWIWSSAKFGYQYNFSSDFEAEVNSENSFFAEPKNGLFIRFSIFVSPSKN